MADQFDVIVIGSGPGGYVCAIRAAQLGLKTACVEKRATLGGTCLNIGCIPSKALLQSSENYTALLHGFADHGVIAGNVSLDLARMQARKGEVVTANVKGVEFLFKKNKVTWLKGEGKLLGDGRVAVSGTEYQAKNIVIATGSESTPLNGRGGRRENHRHLHRRLGTGQGSWPSGGDRRRRDRSGTGQRVAPPRRQRHRN